MKFYLNLFTPETWAAFRYHGGHTSGFRERQRRVAEENVEEGDILLCYLVKLSRWCGALEVRSKAFIEHKPIFSDPDPFTVRFRVQPIVMLDAEHAIPMLDRDLWGSLEITRDIPFAVKGWGIPFRGSLRGLSDSDGAIILDRLKRQGKDQTLFEFSDRDQRQLTRKSTVRTLDGEVTVEVPDDESDVEDIAIKEPSDVRESIRVQAQLASIGVEMGFRVWLPRNDRARVSEHLTADQQRSLLTELPLNYDDHTIRTIEQIDVIWLKGRSMARAFEVEHSTAIYSGLLRMADLLALQPNMAIRLHIVAPDEKRDKVMREIKRPVFSLLDQGPLYEKCTFISYASVTDIAKLDHLAHMSDSIIAEYEESADEH